MFVSVAYEDVEKLPGYPKEDALACKPTSEYSPLRAFLAHAFLADQNQKVDEVVYDVVPNFFPTEYVISKSIDVVYELHAVGSEDIVVSYDDGDVKLMQGKREVYIASLPVFALAGRFCLSSTKPFALRYKASILTNTVRTKFRRSTIDFEVDKKLWQADDHQLRLAGTN